MRYRSGVCATTSLQEKSSEGKRSVQTGPEKEERTAKQKKIKKSEASNPNPPESQGVTDGQQRRSEWGGFRLGGHKRHICFKRSGQKRNTQSRWFRLPGASLPRVSSREFTIATLTLRGPLKRKTSLLVYLDPGRTKLPLESLLSLSSASRTFRPLQRGPGSPLCIRLRRLVILHTLWFWIRLQGGLKLPGRSAGGQRTTPQRV